MFDNLVVFENRYNEINENCMTLILFPTRNYMRI